MADRVVNKLDYQNYINDAVEICLKFKKTKNIYSIIYSRFMETNSDSNKNPGCNVGSGGDVRFNTNADGMSSNGAYRSVCHPPTGEVALL